MANRHKAQGRTNGGFGGRGNGGREKQNGNKEVYASAAAGSKPWAIQKASGGAVVDKAVGKASGGACGPRMDKKARGGRAGGGSPFSSAAFKGG